MVFPASTRTPAGREARHLFYDGPMGHIDFRREWERHYVSSVRAAAQTAFDQAVGRPLPEVYSVLTEELRRRGVEPDPDAVFDGALLISRGRKPAVLKG